MHAHLVPDPISGFCLDAFIQSPLLAGSYTLVITEWNNSALGTLSDGFQQTGNGNFTGAFGCGSGAFCLFDGTQRNSNWALDISGTDVPEPTPAFLMAPVVLAMLRVRVRRRRNA